MFEVKKYQDLVEKIEIFLGKSYEDKIEMALKGRIKVENEFNREIVISKYINEIENIF